MNSLERVSNALIAAHKADDQVNGPILAQELKRLEALDNQEPEKSPDDAGIENIFGESNIGQTAGAVVRVLAQP